MITKGCLPIHPTRRIRAELYHQTGYDAVWRLSNAGFVMRINGTFLFIDPIFTSPLPDYAAIRERAHATGKLDTYAQELKHYERFDDLFRETHDLPLPPEDVEQADCVLVTHEHHDHLDPTGLAKIAHLDPTVVAPASCHAEVLNAGYPKDSVLEATHGRTFDFESFSVEVVPAEHHGSSGACGYLIKTGHGTIFHPGDGKFDHAAKEYVVNLDVDYLLVPINDMNLGAGLAALLTHLLQPRVVIPCHYGYVYPPVRFQGGHPAEFVTALAARNYAVPNTDIMVLNPGGRLILGPA